MPYNLRHNANGRRESRSNDDETTSTSIKTAESVNPTPSASVETELALDLEKRVTRLMEMFSARRTGSARQSASAQASRRESGRDHNAQQGGHYATTTTTVTQHEDEQKGPELEKLLAQVRGRYHERDISLRKEMVKLRLLYEINMEYLSRVGADGPFNDQWEVNSN